MAARQYKTVEEYVESVIRLEKSGQITADECSQMLLDVAKAQRIPARRRIPQVRTAAFHGLLRARRRQARTDERECELAHHMPDQASDNPERSLMCSSGLDAALSILGGRDLAVVGLWLSGAHLQPADRTRVSRALAKVRARFSLADLL